MNGFKTLKEGQKVSFEVTQGPGGQAGLQHTGRLIPRADRDPQEFQIVDLSLIHVSE